MALTHYDTCSEARLRALCGLSRNALETLFTAAVPALLARRQAVYAQRPGRRRAYGGGRKRRLSPQAEILLTLIYLRHNVAHEVVGGLFDVSADTSENTFHEVIAVLPEVCPAQRWDAEKKWRKGEPSWRPEAADRILVDSFETPVPRPSRDAAQRRVYSGKQKRHTLKTQVVTDGQGEVLEITAGYRGPTADKRLYEQSGVAARYRAAERYGDKAYQGTEGVRVPHKKPQGGTLTPEQRDANRAQARVRVRVEHGIRRIKAFRIVRDEYRLAFGLFPRVAGVVVGLVHLMRLVGAASS
jgi:hypothetical protein